MVWSIKSGSGDSQFFIINVKVKPHCIHHEKNDLAYFSLQFYTTTGIVFQDFSLICLQSFGCCKTELHPLPFRRLSSIKDFNSFLFNRNTNLRILYWSRIHTNLNLCLLHFLTSCKVVAGRMLKVKRIQYQ